MDHRRPRNPPVRPLVLLVEGHEDTRAMYALALSASGFDVIAAQDGAEVYARVWEIHPDIIVTDLPTPHHDGWAFLGSLKRDARTRDIPVVAVSGFGEPSLLGSAEREAFAAFFPKPCLPDELAAGLREVLQSNAGRCMMPTSAGQEGDSSLATHSQKASVKATPFRTASRRAS
jgi:two-component system cell cycle response regulator DivK